MYGLPLRDSTDTQSPLMVLSLQSSMVPHLRSGCQPLCRVGSALVHFRSMAACEELRGGYSNRVPGHPHPLRQPLLPQLAHHLPCHHLPRRSLPVYLPITLFKQILQTPIGFSASVALAGSQSVSQTQSHHFSSSCI